MKKISCLAIAVSLIQSVALAQSGRLKRADNYYRSVSYALAAEEYESLLGSKVDSPRMKANLADSYFHMGDTKKSELYYSQMIQSPEARPQDIYTYAQVLKENGNYVESDKWMKQYAVVNPDDSRVKEFTAQENYLEQIAGQGVHFTINNVSINTDAADFGGYPSTDGREVYFVTGRTDRAFVKNIWSWNNKRFLDVYTADLASNNNLENAELFSRSVNTKYHEGPLCFSADGKRVYLTRNNISKGVYRKDEKGIQQLKLYTADVNPNGTWSNEQEFAYNSREYSTGHPTLSPDGKTLYFASSMSGGFGGADLYKCAVNADGTFGKPENLGAAINTEGQDMFPWISPEGHLFFSSDGHTGLGGLDVFIAFPEVDKFTKILNVGEPINSNKDDFAFTMNVSGKIGYFSSNREGGKGDDDIYSYVLTKPFKTELIVSGIAREVGTGATLENATIRLMDNNHGTSKTLVTSADGSYSFELEPGNSYSIEGEKSSYFSNKILFGTTGLLEGTKQLQQDIALEKDPGLALQALIIDAATQKPLEGVKMTIVDNVTKQPFVESVTPVSGDIIKGLSGKRINDRLSYTIKLEKEGYLAKTMEFTTTITKPGVIRLQDALDLSMGKISVGADLASLIDIRPIYFDLGKYIIRPDAARELEKIVKVMNDYPTMEIELGSHTDCRGSIASNEKLSDNRAKASAAYVQARITNPNRINGKGYGESKLKNGCACEGAVKSTCSDAEHQENRRTEFIILKM